MKIGIYCGAKIEIEKQDFDFYIGVDSGAAYLLKQQLPLDMAIGDFDSVDRTTLALIKQQAKQFIQAPQDKDDTDSQLAIKAALAAYPEAQVYLLGALGGRLDHSLTNIFLPSHPDIFPLMQQITLLDKQNHVTFYPSGQHQILPIPEMRYIAFMSEGGKMQIRHAKFELTQANFFSRKVYGSNEFIGSPIKLDVEQGYAVVIQTKD